MAEDDTDTLDDTDTDTDTSDQEQQQQPQPKIPERPTPQPFQRSLASLMQGATPIRGAGFIPTPPANVDPNQFQRQQAYEQSLRQRPQPPQAPPGWPAGMPPPWRQPYRRSTPRPFDQMGDDWWPVQGSLNYPGNEIGPLLPSWPESNQLIGQIGQKQVNWGSQYVGEPAGRASYFTQQIMQAAPMLDMISKGQFSRNFMAARLANFKMLEQEQLFHTKEMIDRWQQQLLAFKHILRQEQFGGITQQEAEDQIRTLGAQTGHNNIGNIIANQGLKGVYNYLQQEDQDFRDVYAAYASKKKSSGGAGGEHPYMEGGEAGAGDQGLPGPQGPQTQGQQAQAGAGPIPTPSGPGGAMDKDLKSQYHLNDDGVRAAQAEAQGDPVPGIKRYPQDDAHVGQAAAAIQSRVGQIANDPNLNTQQKLDQIRAINPGIASDIQSYGQYDRDPEKAPSANRRHALQWTSEVYGGKFHERFYTIAGKYRDANTKVGAVMTRAAGLQQAELSVLNALLPMKENESIPRRVLEAIWQNNANGAADYPELFQALRNYATEVVGIQTFTGTPRVYLVNQMLQHMLATNSPAQIRAQMVVDARNTWSLVQGVNEQWQSETNDPTGHMPLLTERAVNNQNAILRMNPYTGVMPKGSDIPDEVQAVGKTGQDVMSNLKPWQKLPPLTSSEAAQAHAFINQFRGDPRQEVQDKIRFLQQRLGINPLIVPWTPPPEEVQHQGER
jgi:hypothetical protein